MSGRRTKAARRALRTAQAGAKEWAPMFALPDGRLDVRVAARVLGVLVRWVRRNIRGGW